MIPIPKNSPYWPLIRGVYVLGVLGFMLWANYNRFDGRDWTTLCITLLSLAGFDYTKMKFTE